MAIILVNNRAYQAKQYLCNFDAPQGVKHCDNGGRNPEDGHGHLDNGNGGSVSHGSWLIYNKSKIVKVIPEEDFKDGNIGTI